MSSSQAPGIVVFCRNCGKKNRAPAAAAGKRGACAQCGQLMAIPEQSEAGPPEGLTEPPVSSTPPQPEPKPAPAVEQQAAPKAPPVSKEEPAPIAFEPPPLVATPPDLTGKEEMPFDGALPELDAILKDLDDLLPSPGKQRAGEATRPKCPGCGALLDPGAEACVRCGWRAAKRP
jgi:RNase P subunit RPR2